MDCSSLYGQVTGTSVWTQLLAHFSPFIFILAGFVNISAFPSPLTNYFL